MMQSISAARLRDLVGDFSREPAYAGLAEAIVEVLAAGRVPYGARLPSERDLTEALAVSRTTVAGAYASLRAGGYAEARRGAGTFARLPGGPAQRVDRALQPVAPAADGTAGIDLGCAATSAAAGLAAAFTEAAAELPAYLGGHGYFPAGLPVLQAEIAASYTARGLPTEPDEIVVTPGALSALALVERALGGPGTRVVVESPAYPNAAAALRSRGARLVPAPVDPDGWDVAATGRVLRAARADLSYLIPDFQNPTGHLMGDEDRERLAAHLRASGTVPVVDEANVSLALDGQSMPRPFAAFAPATITLGSASKSYWGGLRLGWVRASRDVVARVVEARPAVDLGCPVMEQLVLASLLRQGPVLPGYLAQLREQRATLVAALRRHLPAWRFVVPGGGLALWVELPDGSSTALAAAAERLGVTLAPGPVFAPGGGLDRFVRVPWTRPPHELETAVARVARAREAVAARGSSAPGPRRVTVA